MVNIQMIQKKLSQVRVLYSAEKIQATVETIAREIIVRHKEAVDIVLVGIMKGGSFCFLPDLSRVIQAICPVMFIDVQYLGISRYGQEHLSNRPVRIYLDLDISTQDRVVVLVEDIIEDGATIMWALEHFQKNHRAKRVEVAALLKRDGVLFQPAYTFLPVKKGYWVVGYGMEENVEGRSYLRSLPYLGYLPK